MTRILFGAALALALSTTTALACSEADVQARQASLLEAFQQLVAVDQAKAQALLLQMQADIDAAAAAGDDAAVCTIMDEALATAQGG